MAPIIPVNIGRRLNGTDFDKIVSAPDTMPEHPRPEIALPMIRTVEFGAAPHIAEPISKMATLRMKIHLIENIVYNFPTGSWKQDILIIMLVAIQCVQSCGRACIINSYIPS